MNRRALLKNSGILLGTAGLLTACRQRSTIGPVGAPRRGGTLRIGMLGAGKSESFNPSTTTSAMINLARAAAVFNPLVEIAPDLSLRPSLATAWHHDPTATRWTFALRPGVTWHDGKPFTADDVIHSLRWLSEPDNPLASSMANVDLKKTAKQDATTVVVALKSPDLDLPRTIAGNSIIQDGVTTFGRPVGTGPFVFDSFTPGQRSVCRRNPRYWSPGRPYLDELVISSIDDETARVNALLGGQIDVVCQMPYPQARAYQKSGAIRLLNSPSPAAHGFYMAVDAKPFDDVRVRQALRLLADRRQLVDVALYGFGAVGNDVFGSGLPYFDSGLPQRGRDVGKAKELLSAAGHGAGLTLTLETAAAAPGMVEAATLFAEQVKDAGVTIEVVQVDSASYFDPTVQYLRRPFGQTFWSGMTSLAGFYQFAVLPDGAGNETHWNDERTAGLYQQAVAAADPGQAARAWRAIQQEQWDNGGYIWWGSADNVDAVSARVGGITPSRYMSLGLPGSLVESYVTT
ncbi:ABC transporter substrate-binding protein [Nonomuraea sediminis]|uniref:ABC transporter substrate-binding protein n=1 Tax=Nonomuraea sediminis TaxID=2835864 RepID=UPI001BDCC57C|nr:ABC transporter substrate-binding protein [Nonomuraea sediminis]